MVFPVVLIHGLLGPLADACLQPALASWQVVAPDFAGYGAHVATGGTLTIQARSSTSTPLRTANPPACPSTASVTRSVV